VSADPDPRPSGPPPLEKPTRQAMTVRHLLAALGAMVLVVLVVAGVSGSCSFAPGGPRVDPGAGPTVDAPAELRSLAPAVPFPLRVPVVPPGWRANAVDQDRVPDGGRAVRAGWVTPEGRYLRLVQSDAAEQAVLAVAAGAGPVAAAGPVDVGGQRWVVHTREDEEPIWTTDLGDVRLLVTGSGSDADFRALAGGALAGEVLAR
jgi:hypothetical protein